MELIARVLITIPDDKWQEEVDSLVREEQEELKECKAKLGEDTYARRLKNVDATVIGDIKFDLGKTIEGYLQNQYKHDSLVQNIQFIEFEES